MKRRKYYYKDYASIQISNNSKSHFSTHIVWSKFVRDSHRKMNLYKQHKSFIFKIKFIALKLYNRQLNKNCFLLIFKKIKINSVYIKLFHDETVLIKNLSIVFIMSRMKGKERIRCYLIKISILIIYYYYYYYYYYYFIINYYYYYYFLAK